MASKKTRVDNIHDQMPKLYNTRDNDNWKALVESLGDVDQQTLDLIESVRQQFFVKTASRPYLDRLGTANLVQRPRFVGMDDPTFRDFIPVMSYQPKQVKLIMDKLLDIFFFKESTTSFISSGLTAPFNLEDEWELEYDVDNFAQERIEFRSEEFTDINNASADEVVAAINRQSTNSYAIAFENSITKLVNIRIFTKTVGSKGSIKVTGGKANIGLQFDGYNTGAGNGVATEWNIDKVGDTVTMTYTGTGGTPNINQLQVGDVVIITRSGNDGSFVLTSVDPTNNKIQYVNLFATNETFTQSATDDVKFMTPTEANVYLRDRRAIVWEIKPGEIIVEMPPTPPVVQRRRIGSAHINGIESLVSSTTSTTSLELSNPDKFPDTGGRFFFIPLNEIQTYHPIDSATDIHQFNSKLSSDLPVYTYASKVGSELQGISPTLPTSAIPTSINLVSANRNNNNLLTVTTSTPHDFNIGEYAIIEDVVYPTPLSYSTDFDGIDDFSIVTSPNAAITSNITNKLSVFNWIKSTGSAGTAAFFNHWDGGNQKWYIGQVSGGDLEIILSSNGSALTKRYSIPAGFGALDGSWRHVGFTYDGTQASANQLKIYLDGVDITSSVTKLGDSNLSTLFQPASDYFALGASVSASMPGRIDEPCMFNEPLTGTEVLELYNSGNVLDLTTHSKFANLVGWWSMGDGDTFPTISDKTANGNDFTMTNMDAGDFVLDSPGGTPLTGLDVDGAWKITAINSTTEFECYSFSGPFGARSSTGGTVRVERVGVAESGSRVILTTAQIEEGLEGPYLWDENSDFVLSGLTTDLTAQIKAGTTQRNIQVDPNDIPNESGRLIFDFGTEKQEGPVRYFFKPSSTSLALDPSYVFQYTHNVESSVTMIRRRGGIKFDGLGSEYAGYITDPAAAREVLQELMEEVKSVGIFINFLVRYPEQFYATLDVYRSGVDPG